MTPVTIGTLTIGRPSGTQVLPIASARLWAYRYRDRTELELIVTTAIDPDEGAPLKATARLFGDRLGEGFADGLRFEASGRDPFERLTRPALGYHERDPLFDSAIELRPTPEGPELFWSARRPEFDGAGRIYTAEITIRAPLTVEAVRDVPYTLNQVETDLPSLYGCQSMLVGLPLGIAAGQLSGWGCCGGVFLAGVVPLTLAISAGKVGQWVQARRRRAKWGPNVPNPDTNDGDRDPPAPYSLT